MRNLSSAKKSLSAYSARLAQISPNNLFTRKSAERISANLLWLASATADQALLAGSIHSSPDVTAKLAAISAALDSLSNQIGGDHD
jgi:hypothetical protein